MEVRERRSDSLVGVECMLSSGLCLDRVRVHSCGLLGNNDEEMLSNENSILEHLLAFYKPLHRPWTLLS